jgi:hypothetical protein
MSYAHVRMEMFAICKNMCCSWFNNLLMTLPTEWRINIVGCKNRHCLVVYLCVFIVLRIFQHSKWVFYSKFLAWWRDYLRDGIRLKFLKFSWSDNLVTKCLSNQDIQLFETILQQFGCVQKHVLKSPFQQPVYTYKFTCWCYAMSKT